MEHPEADPTALDPEEILENPPPGFIPQTELGPGQEPGIVERESDLIDDAEAENPDDLSEDDGDADDGDDADEGDDDA